MTPNFLIEAFGELSLRPKLAGKTSGQEGDGEKRDGILHRDF